MQREGKTTQRPWSCAGCSQAGQCSGALLMWVSSGVPVSQRMLRFYQGSAEQPKQPRPCFLLRKNLGGPGDAEKVCFQPYVLKICWRRNIKVRQLTLLFSLSGWARREGSPLFLPLSTHLHPQRLRVQQLLGLPQIFPSLSSFQQNCALME